MWLQGDDEPVMEGLESLSVTGEQEGFVLVNVGEIVSGCDHVTCVCDHVTCGCSHVTCECDHVTCGWSHVIPYSG